MDTSRKAILYIAASLDGYIAGPEDDMSFLNPMHVEGEDYGYAAFAEQVDTVIMGRRTYEWVMTQVPEYPHPEWDSYIITRTPRPGGEKLQFYTGSLKTLIADLKSKEGKHIFIDGGAQVVHELLKEQLVDELIISVVPVLLGEGVRLFKDGRPGQNLELLGSQSYSTGLVQLRYRAISA